MLESSTHVVDFKGTGLLNDGNEGFTFTQGEGMGNAFYSNSAGQTEVTNAAAYLAQHKDN